MSDLQQDLKDLIAKSLPSVAVDELRRRLDAGERDAKALSDKTAAYERLEKAHGAVAGELSRHAALTDRATALDRREGELVKRENTLAVHEADAKGALTRVADMKEVLALVFKSPELRGYMVSLSSNLPVKDPNGYNTQLYASGEAKPT